MSQGGFTERQAAQILRGLMLFLAHVHSRGIAHMDIKVREASWSRCESLMILLDCVSCSALGCMGLSGWLSGKEVVE